MFDKATEKAVSAYRPFQFKYLIWNVEHFSNKK